MTSGYATPSGTTRFVSRFSSQEKNGFYREAFCLRVSSLGIGTYLGGVDEQTDRAYVQAIRSAVNAGINFVDTAINYRHQRSERCVGDALRELRRDEVVVCTKAGFLTPGAVPEFLKPEDVVGGMHSMAPDFLADQIDRSCANMDIETIDIFYLHNPEAQLKFVSPEQFESRIRAAFARLEASVSEGKIRCYGTATWDGYRKPDALDLSRLIEIARQEGGEDHHFRFIQVPFNLGMVEAFVRKPESVLEVAVRSGVTVVASATLLQSRLTGDVPEAVAERLPGLTTDAQRAIQFTRSTPGITVALVGMSNAAHVAENVGVAAVPPAAVEQYLRMYQ